MTTTWHFHLPHNLAFFICQEWTFFIYQHFSQLSPLSSSSAMAWLLHLPQPGSGFFICHESWPMTWLRLLHLLTSFTTLSLFPITLIVLLSLLNLVMTYNSILVIGNKPFISKFINWIWFVYTNRKLHCTFMSVSSRNIPLLKYHVFLFFFRRSTVCVSKYLIVTQYLCLIPPSKYQCLTQYQCLVPLSKYLCLTPLKYQCLT